jgi:uncharacterized protein
MLLEFSLGNYRSFNSIQTLDFRATSLVSEDKLIDDQNIIDKGDSKVLKTIGLYGPNGSGKSNLLIGLRLFCQLVRSSLESEAIMEFAAEPFKLTTSETTHDGFFQVLLLIDYKKYRYGFTLTRNGEVQQEWLFGPAEKNETWYFKRSNNSIECNKEWFEEGHRLPLDNLRPNTLFLTFVSAYNGALAQSLRQFIISISFENRITPNRGRRVLYRVGGSSTSNHSTNNLLREGKTDLVLKWMNSAGLQYSNIKLEETSNREYEFVVLEKSIYNSDGVETGKVEMDLSENESSGTQKFYSLIGRLYQKFTSGGVIVADEIDNNFHPSLLQHFIHFFNDNELNKKGAQLLFTSHDTNLLNPNILRRDQIYFTEKSIKDESLLYSLADLKGVRNNSDFARQYLAGFYGALPILQDLKLPNND